MQDKKGLTNASITYAVRIYPSYKLFCLSNNRLTPEKRAFSGADEKCVFFVCQTRAKI